MDITRIDINGDEIERVSCAELGGCHIMGNISWEDHIAKSRYKSEPSLSPTSPVANMTHLVFYIKFF